MRRLGPLWEVIAYWNREPLGPPPRLGPAKSTGYERQFIACNLVSKLRYV